MARICVVDDNQLLRDSLVETLMREDHDVQSFPEPRSALAALRNQRFDAMIVTGAPVEVPPRGRSLQPSLIGQLNTKRSAAPAQSPGSPSS